MNADASTAPELDDEIAFEFIVRWLRDGRPSVYNTYGYDVYLTEVLRHYVMTVRGVEDPNACMRPMRTVSPHFYAAAWEMARRGILRPGVTGQGVQGTDEGQDGEGFSLTPAGRKWLDESGHYEFVPVVPGRFASQLSALENRFGPGYEERAQEAVRCYSALAYMACCAMCGAAAESIVLAIAIAKTGDAESVEQLYMTKGGRGRIENQIAAGLPAGAQNELRGFTSLLKYWRDSASHGSSANIGDPEAYTSLAILLRFALFAESRWDALTIRSNQT